MGDPAGIGPELCLRLLQHKTTLRIATPVIFGDLAVLIRAGRRCGLPRPERVVPKEEWEAVADIEITGPMVVDCMAVEPSAVRPGQISAQCGRAAYTYIRHAVSSVMKGRLSALVTCPIHKAALHMAKVPHVGHTDMLAQLTGAKSWCMMMASQKICVSLVTDHIPYRDVPAALNPDRILAVIRLTHDAMKKLGIRRPRLTLCGLNPHAGDEGVIGDEESRLIQPALEQARVEGILVEGCFPPDSAFLPTRRAVTDAYVAMYHDQGLIPFKLLAFDTGVNVTLGLPIVRTSVDHGTAFDIAWQGRASPSSLFQSVRWAVRLCQKALRYQ